VSARTIPLTDELRAYLLRVGVREDAALVALRERTAALPESRMQICPEQGAFLTVFARAVAARRILEVGTFTGYSALAFAHALPADGELVCCDVSEPWTTIARAAWTAAGVSDRVRLHLGPAVDTLDALLAAGQAGTFDLAFVDADKGNYHVYHERCLQLVRRGGVVLYDNVLWGGRLVDAADRTPDTVALRAFNEALAVDPRVDLSMLPVGDGLTIALVR
jgi:predicted O-methyltransferase YrrM